MPVSAQASLLIKSKHKAIAIPNRHLSFYRWTRCCLNTDLFNGLFQCMFFYAGYIDTFYTEYGYVCHS